MDDFLETLRKQFQGEDTGIEIPMSPEVPITQEDVKDAELAQVNDEAKSPNLQTKPERAVAEVKQEMQTTPQGQAMQEVPKSEFQQFMDKYDTMYSKNQEDIKAARESDQKRAMLANIAKALGNLGAASVQRGVGLPVGLKQFKPVEGPNTAGQLEKDRKALMDKLIQDYKLMQSGKAKELSKKDLADIKLKEAQAKKLEQEAKKGPEPTFEEKEEKKAEIKQRLEDKKEKKKELQTFKKSVDDIDSQIEKVRRAKTLLANTVQNTTIADTGPLDQFLAGTSEEGQALRQSFNDLSLEKMSKLFKGMSKAIDSDAERKMFEQSQASMSNYPAVNMKILDEMEKNLVSLKSKNQNAIQELSAPEQQTSKQVVKKQYSPSRNQTRIIYQDGSMEILDGKR